METGWKTLKCCHVVMLSCCHVYTEVTHRAKMCTDIHRFTQVYCILLKRHCPVKCKYKTVQKAEMFLILMSEV